jgi:hypothetical protein
LLAQTPIENMLKYGRFLVCTTLPVRSLFHRAAKRLSARFRQ